MPSDWDAATYDRISNPQFRWATVVVERLDTEGLRTLLDAGCGSGRVTELLLRRFPDVRVVGVDASENMLAEARRRLEPFGDRVRLERADLTEPLPVDGAVDAIFSTAVFHWIRDHDRLFRVLAEALRPGGQLVAQWGGRGNIARLLEVARDIADDLEPSNFAGPEETAARLEAAGFVDVRTWLHDDPADFDTREAFEEYLHTVCLRCHLDLVAPDERDAFVRAVADRLPDRRVDYVRLNAVARRA